MTSGKAIARKVEAPGGQHADRLSQRDQRTTQEYGLPLEDLPVSSRLECPIALVHLGAALLVETLCSLDQIFFVRSCCTPSSALREEPQQAGEGVLLFVRASRSV